MTMQLPGRVARLEGAFEQIADRLNGVDSRPAALEQKVDLGFDAVERKFNVIYGFLFGPNCRSFSARLRQRYSRCTGSALTDGAFHLHLHEPVQLDRVLHRQLLYEEVEKAVDDHRDGVGL